MIQPASFTDPGQPDAEQCDNCGGYDFEDVDDVVEDTDGRCYRVRLLVCVDCGKAYKP